VLRFAHGDARRDGRARRADRAVESAAARALYANGVAKAAEADAHTGRWRAAGCGFGERRRARHHRPHRHRRRRRPRHRIRRLDDSSPFDGGSHDDLQHVGRSGWAHRHDRAGRHHVFLSARPPARASPRSPTLDPSACARSPTSASRRSSSSATSSPASSSRRASCVSSSTSRSAPRARR